MNILIVDDEQTALRDLSHVLAKVVPSAAVFESQTSEEALELCRGKTKFDVVFLDISMPGKDGLSLAKELKTIAPLINIVMVTAYPNYALDALRIYVSGYILKPAMEAEVREALGNLRNPVSIRQTGLYVQCFGNFEVFYDGSPVSFRRTKSKELFAYLIDRKGATATNSEIRAILWMDETRDEGKQSKYFAQVVYELQHTLEELGLSDIFLHSRDSYAIVPGKIVCDYYLALEQDAQSLYRYEGEYMNQYEWAMYRIGTARNELKMLRKR